MIIAALTGPTASGKSACALEWAEQNACEIISADSMQVYEGFAIGTAQPNFEDLQRVRHHLVGFLAPDASFSAGNFADALQKFHADEKSYLVVGGTGFYLSTMLAGLADLPEISEASAQKAQEMIEFKGLSGAFEFLNNLDPVFCARIEAADAYRINRGLEVYFETGELYSSFLSRPKKGAIHVPLYSMEMETALLNERINARTLAMIDSGWLEEVEALLALHNRDSRAFRVLGYPQVIDYIEGRTSKSSAIEKIQQLTRQLAKRQRTFLRGQFPGRISIENETEFKKMMVF